MAGVNVGPSRFQAAMGGLNKLGQNYGGGMAGAAQQSGRMMGMRPNRIARPPAIGGGGALPGMQTPMPQAPTMPLSTAPSPMSMPPMMGPSPMPDMNSAIAGGGFGGGMAPAQPIQPQDMSGMFSRYGQTGQNPNRRY